VLVASLPLIIGHRGASAVAPENTMAAFQEAIAAGADGIEFDVRLSRDGVPVIIHDSTLRRTTGLPHRVADLTWQELESLKVAVPSLQQLFTLFEGNDLGLYLEMKSDSPADREPLAKACSRLINDYAFKDRVMVECFDLPALEVIKTIDPEIKTVALFEPAFRPSVFSNQLILDRVTAIGASAIALHHRIARSVLVRKAKDAGLAVAVWTVDDPAWIERARATGIDALITNNPAAMLSHR
jgi:glycerophosphoryl diester phosphodiesterase